MHKTQDNMCKEFASERTVTSSQPFYDVRNLPLEAVSEDSHLMPITIYQVGCPQTAQTPEILI